MKDNVNKTWNKFKKFFSDKYEELNEEQRFNSQELGFHGTNAILQEELALMAMAATANRDTIAQITVANKQLMEANNQLVLENKTLGDQVAALTKTIETLINKIRKTKSDQWPRDQQPPPRNDMNKTQNHGKWDPKGYCWTHGYKVKKGHTSACCDLGDIVLGHQCRATRANTMRGSQANKGWENEP